MTEPTVGDIVDGRYKLEELIGKGGMGLVFRARHVFTHQQVALKLITTGLDSETMARFLAEARVAATIGHPAIVETSDANRTPDGQLYLVMELLAGKPLRVAMASPLSADDIKRIGLEILDAIAAAHARGVVHRDLKPENIYLVAPTGAVKVLDFGIAKMRGGSTTGQGMVLGTLEYMAPEQLVDSGAVDARADLWAVGVILYELISGVRPYRGSREELFQALASLEPTPITTVATVPDDVAAFLATALARDPARRFQTAAQMTAAIRRLTLARSRSLPTTIPIVDTAGPTMGTGAAWVNPHAPQRAKTLSAPPIATEGGPALASTAIQSQLPSARVPKRRRWWIVAALAAIAVAVVVVIGVTRSTDPEVIVEVPVDHPARCAAACKKLAGCGLAQNTCEQDCAGNGMKPGCVEQAADCSQLAACVWEQTCGSPPSGTRSCAETLICHQDCTNHGCRCGCNRDLTAQGALEMGRLFVCKENNPTDEGFTRNCGLVRDVCIDGKVIAVPPTSQRPPSPVVTPACKATCDQLATCGLAMPTCTTDCATGGLDVDCLQTATTCGERARCYWNKLCGRPIKTGTTTCTEMMACWGRNAAQPIAEQCSTCYDQMSAPASLDFGRYHACFNGALRQATLDPSFDANKMIKDRCEPLMKTCYGMK